MPLEIGEFELKRQELTNALFVAMYWKMGVDIKTIALLPGFEFINESIKKIMDENFFNGAHIEDLGGRIVTDWNAELRDTRGEDIWSDFEPAESA